MKSKHLVIILGPTGIGKTEVAVKLAERFRTEIISADSRQFYKELTIGTAVPTPEQSGKIRHHLVRHLSVQDYYNVSMYEQQAIGLINKIFRTRNILFMTGGSGMYIDVICRGIDEFPEVNPRIRESLAAGYRKHGIEDIRYELQRLDPEYYRMVDPNNPNRMLKALEVCHQTGRPYSSFLRKKQVKRPFSILKIGLNMERNELYDRINRRVERMIEKGLVEEARRVLPFRKTNALNTLGYKEIFRYLEGEIPLDRAVELIKRNSRRYARRQLTWFGKDRQVRWFHPDDTGSMIGYIEELCSP